MAIAVFSVNVAAFSALALGAPETGLAIGAFSCLGLWLGKRWCTRS